MSEGTNLDLTREWLGGVAAEGLSRVELVASLDKGLVREWRWPAGQAGTDAGNLDARATEIVRTAERDGVMKAQKEVGYLLMAFRPDDQGGQFFAKHPIKVPGANAKGTTAAAGAADEQYSADALGLAAMALKYMEISVKTTLAACEGRTASYERQIQTMSEREESHERRHLQLLNLTETLASLKVEREISEQQLRLDERKHLWLVDKMDKLAPIAMNRFLGGGPGTGKLYMGEELIRQLFGSMDGSTIDAIAKGQPFSLTQEQALLVMEIVSTYGEAERAREKIREQAAKRDLNGGKTNGTSGPAAAAGKEGEPS